VNAVEIEEAISVLAESSFDAVEFPFAFLRAFGNKETTLQRLRKGESNKSDVGGVLQTNNIHMAVAPHGEVTQTVTRLRTSPATAKGKVKFILATDGDTFEAEDLVSGDTVVCAYTDFPNHFGFFLPLAGISTVRQITENAFDIRATSRLNRLYVELLKTNPEWSTEARRHDMNHFMARLIFCFFAEDTDIFPRGPQGALFTSTVETMSARDSSDTHEVISELFLAMNTKQAERAEAGVPRWADTFPYVNGGLFAGSLDVPRFSKLARSYLMHIGGLDWQRINPDIFGSMIQAVAEDEERGELGMHYTSVPNILKVLNPLFLDELRAKLEEAGDNARSLLNLRKRMARIRVFDPACGSGNFLVIAYKEMRAIEAEINRRRNEVDRASEIPLTNYRGIELRDFPCEIARLALIIAEYQCDVLYRGHKLALAEFLPLEANNWITCGNALRLDWLSVCPPTGKGVKLNADDLFGTPLNQAQIDFENEGGETFVCGNPPYVGGKRVTEEHKADLEVVFGKQAKGWKSLDYVAGWILKAARYGELADARSALVCTNSICQGQQVSILWPLVADTGHVIEFAYTSFRWSNLASHNAVVTVAIIGLSRHPRTPRRLFSVEEGGEVREQQVTNINAYLVAADDVFVRKEASSISGLSEMQSGSKMTDGSNLIFTREDVQSIVREYPEAMRLFKWVVGGDDLISGLYRWSIWVEDSDVKLAESIPPIAARLDAVRAMRAASSKPATRALAAVPHQFDERRYFRKRFVGIPQTSSERREYLSCNYFESDVIIIAPHLFLATAELFNLALLVSRIHIVWIATVCGKLETRYRYSNTLGWNTFPVPTLTDKNKADLARCAENILLAREVHYPDTIADLYDPDAMPANLRDAHEQNDEVLERIYIGRRFRNDTERLEKLFELYTKMTTTPAAASRKGVVA
jgi:hypothetical protein